MPPPPAAAADRNANGTGCGRSRRACRRRRSGRARPRRCHSDDGLSKAFSFLSGCRPVVALRHLVYGKIAEWLSPSHRLFRLIGAGTRRALALTRRLFRSAQGRLQKQTPKLALLGAGAFSVGTLGAFLEAIRALLEIAALGGLDLRSSAAVDCLRSCAASLPLAVGALLTPMRITPVDPRQDCRASVTVGRAVVPYSAGWLTRRRRELANTMTSAASGKPAAMMPSSDGGAVVQRLPADERSRRRCRNTWPRR